MAVLSISRRPAPATFARRAYHDLSYGSRMRHDLSSQTVCSFVSILSLSPALPDSPAQLHNRAINAPLLRFTDGMRMHGHRAANIDPLGLLERLEVPALDPSRYGLKIGACYDVNGIIWNNDCDESKPWPLEHIVNHLRTAYVGAIAFEYMHSISKAERLWFSRVLEADASKSTLPPSARRRIWKLLASSEILDQFLHTKFPGLKRYGLEGAESMLPALDTLFSEAASAGVSHLVLAMPHRGRLNLLINLLSYSPVALFHKIKGAAELPSGLGLSGDVISHLVCSPTLKYNKEIQIELLPNPSHLEAINPVALGKVRAKQSVTLTGEGSLPEDRAICVQIHGDTSFTGQGVVMECFGLS